MRRDKHYCWFSKWKACGYAKEDINLRIECESDDPCEYKLPKRPSLSPPNFGTVQWTGGGNGGYIDARGIPMPPKKGDGSETI